MILFWFSGVCVGTSIILSLVHYETVLVLQCVGTDFFLVWQYECPHGKYSTRFCEWREIELSHPVSCSNVERIAYGLSTPLGNSPNPRQQSTDRRDLSKLLSGSSHHVNEHLLVKHCFTHDGISCETKYSRAFTWWSLLTFNTLIGTKCTRTKCYVWRFYRVALQFCNTEINRIPDPDGCTD